MYSSCCSCCFFFFFLPQLLLVLLLCGLLCRTLATRVSSVVVCVATSCCCPCSALNYTFMDSTLVRSSLSPCTVFLFPLYARFAAAIVLTVCLSLPSLSYELMQFLEFFLRFRSLFFLFIRVNFVFANVEERAGEEYSFPCNCFHLRFSITT